jgi:hypothetical protein
MLYKLARQLMLAFVFISLCGIIAISAMLYQEGSQDAIYVTGGSMFMLMLLLSTAK